LIGRARAELPRASPQSLVAYQTKLGVLMVVLSHYERVNGMAGRHLERHNINCLNVSVAIVRSATEVEA